MLVNKKLLLLSLMFSIIFFTVQSAASQCIGTYTESCEKISFDTCGNYFYFDSNKNVYRQCYPYTFDDYEACKNGFGDECSIKETKVTKPSQINPVPSKKGPPGGPAITPWEEEAVGPGND